MRLGPTLVAATFLAVALLPGMASAAEGHEGHGASGPSNPMLKSVTLYLDGSRGLTPEVPAAGTVPAGAATPNGASTPVLWEAEATRNSVLDSSVFVDVYARVLQPTLSAGGPEGATYRVQLALNGEPVEGIATSHKAQSALLAADEIHRIKLFLPQPAEPIALKPGDRVGILVSFFGLNPESSPAVAYAVGGEPASFVAFRVRYASLAEVDIPKEVGSWPIAPLEGFDFAAAAKRDPAAKVVTLRAFQFGFHGAPIVVPNGTKVVLQMYVDESLSTAGEGHGGHDHGAGATGPWDQTAATALHGFSLASYDPRLETVLFDGLVVTMTFTADKPGNYTFLCSVFCGTGHGRMLDRLEVQGAPPPVDGLDQQRTLGPGGDGAARQAPGFEAAALVAGLAALALVARRRR